MKTNIPCCAALCCAALTFARIPLQAESAEPAEPPPVTGLDRTYVTIPYTELRALWEAGHKPKEAEAKVENPPPVPYVIDRIDCRVQLGEGVTAVDATYQIQGLASTWQTVPLYNGNANLQSAEPKENKIVWRDGYGLLLDHPEKTNVVLHLAAGPEKTSMGGDGLQLEFPAATVKWLSVSGVPDGAQAMVNGLPALATKDGVATFALAGEAGKATLTITKREELQSKEIQPEKPSHWQVESQTLARYADGRLVFDNHVFARTADGSGASIALYLPANASEIAVAGDDLGDWRAAAAPDGRRMLKVPWKTRDVFDRVLHISYAIPQSPLAEQWNLVAPAQEENNASKAFFVIVPNDGVEIVGKNVKSAVESRRLPQWIRGALEGGAFWSAEGDASLAVTTRWLPEIPTAEAVVTEAKCALRLVVDGGVRTQAVYTIVHQAPLAWKLDLPPDVRLLVCEVDKKAAHPLQRPDGSMEIGLSGARAGGSAVSTVTVVFASATKALDPVSGQVSLRLPKTDLFIEKLNWDISIPAIYEPTAVNANLTSAPAPSSEGREERIIALRKDLCRGEAPTAEIFYQRLGLQQ